MADCKKCRAFCITSTHVCPPVWLIWCEEDGATEEDADEIRAWSAETAVEEWADEYDCGNDYTIVRGGETTVSVRGEDGELLRYAVTGETVTRYSASVVG